MIVAYVLDRFPAISETFISDEIFSVMQAGVACRVFSLEQRSMSVVHPRAKSVVDAGCVIPCAPRPVYRDVLSLVHVFVRHPARALRTLMQLVRDKDHRWIARAALAVASSSLRLGVDHLHAHYADTAAQVTLWAHRWTGLPFTFTTHGYDVFKTPPHNMRELVDDATGMVCISHYNLRYLVDKFSVDVRKLHVIRCGIYTKEFENEIRVPKSTCVPLRLLTVARLVPEKGHQVLLQALRLLTDSGLAVHLKLAGDGPLKQELIDQTQRLGLEHSVEFLGEQTGLQVRQLFQECDLAVLASLSESMGLVNMEGMASGRPVIATAVLGVPELVEDRVTGFLCPPGDPHAISQTIQWILAHPEETKAVLLRGKQRVETEFSRDACTRQLIQLWQSSQR